MDKGKCVGAQSVCFTEDVYILGRAAIVGKKEGEGPLRSFFDEIDETDLFGGENWNDAESRMMQKAAALAIRKAGLTPKQIRLLFAGDLLGQLLASSFGAGELPIPFLGVYGACSTMGESLLLAAMSVNGGFADCAEAVTSSHFASAEKEFRFPLAYGNQRPKSATWTVTGSGAFLLSSEKKEGVGIGITGITTGKIVDFGVKDSMNMGACMAPAAADTILQHMKDFNRTPEDYDMIITGDLGEVGKNVLQDLLLQKKCDITGRYTDCGIAIYNEVTQDTHAGGSGCGCSATVLSAFILHQMEKGIWKRVLFAPTGALLSKVSFNEGKSVPGIAHAIILERL